MTSPQRNELITTLRMLSLSNPKKWAILNSAADEIRRLELELMKMRNGKCDYRNGQRGLVAIDETTGKSVELDITNSGGFSVNLATGEMVEWEGSPPASPDDKGGNGEAERR